MTSCATPIRAFEAGPDQVAVLQADGPAFCVGADLKEPPAAMWKAVPHVSHKLSKPVIGVTQGWVIGGAICMVMTCDLMVSADTTKVHVPRGQGRCVRRPDAWHRVAHAA